MTTYDAKAVCSKVKTALTEAREIILRDLGTEIESIEDALKLVEEWENS